MIKFHILFALSIFIFYKSLFATYSISTTKNTEPISEKRFKKLVYLVLDGLRFDAILPVKKQGKYYNNMTICTDPAVNSRLFLSIAGIPTATLSRVVSLMTGAPTNPIDVLLEFSSRSIQADSIIRRWPPNTAFFGDECWVKSFKELAGCSSTMPSYSRFDQSRRENELVEELIQNIKEGLNKEEQFLFAHLNTLDTYGHAFGTDHEMIQNTLKRWNDYLYKIYNAMDEDTLLVALSDHGVTDLGQHGGSSPEELASFCCFFTKGTPLDNIMLSNAELNDYYRFMRKFYIVDRCNTDEDWIRPKILYNIIHQDDIVVTVSYLMGIAPPFNSYGNLIPFITRDLNALKGLAALKEKHGSPGEPSGGNIENSSRGYEKYNQLLTAQIYTSLTSRNWLGGVVALAVALFLLLKYKAIESWAMLGPVFFTIIMVSHSLYSFACEDYLWLLSLVCTYPSLDSLLSFYFYVKIPKQMPMDRDRFNICRKWGILNLEKFQDFKEPVIIAGIFVLVKIFNWRKLLKCAESLVSRKMHSPYAAKGFVSIDFLRKLEQMFPQLLYVFYSMFFKINERELKILLLSLDPSFLSLLTIHNKPINSLYTLLFLNSLPSSNSSLLLYPILSLVPYCSDLNKMLQAIDYETFFVFSDDYNKFFVLISSFSYLVLPRLIHILRLYRSPSSRRRCFRFLSILGLYVSFICSWAQFGHLTFQLYFINRLLFTTFFAIIDILVLGILELYMHFSGVGG